MEDNGMSQEKTFTNQGLVPRGAGKTAVSGTPRPTRPRLHCPFGVRRALAALVAETWLGERNMENPFLRISVNENGDENGSRG
jgi:hypothetical protein